MQRPHDEGSLTSRCTAGAATDTFGNPGAAHTTTLNLDPRRHALPVPLVPRGLRGNQAFDLSVAGRRRDRRRRRRGRVHDQRRRRPDDHGRRRRHRLDARPTVSLIDPAGDDPATSPPGAGGVDAVIQAGDAATGGTYTIRVGGDARHDRVVHRPADPQRRQGDRAPPEHRQQTPATAGPGPGVQPVPRRVRPPGDGARAASPPRTTTTRLCSTPANPQRPRDETDGVGRVGRRDLLPARIPQRDRRCSSASHRDRRGYRRPRRRALRRARRRTLLRPRQRRQQHLHRRLCAARRRQRHARRPHQRIGRRRQAPRRPPSGVRLPRPVGGDTDYYAVALAAGDVLNLATRTPGDGPGGSSSTR